MKRHLLSLLKIAISVGILGWLFVQAQRNAVFDDLWQRPKRWEFLAGACLLEFLAVLVTLIRWHLLVRALDLPATLRGSLRIGFLGYLFNLAPMGIVGGDLLKAVMLGRQQPGRRTEAVATVFVDRALGLYVLFVLASAAILATGFWRIEKTSVEIVCQATLWLTVAGTALVLLVLLPDVTGGRFLGLLARLPHVGPLAVRLIEAVRMYRRRLPVLALAAVMSAAVHSLFAVAVFLIATGLYDRVHPLATHFVVTPISSATGVLPVTLGPFEGVLNLLYADVPLPGGGNLPSGQGLVVALGYRIIAVLVAAVGLGYYLAARREVAEILHEAEGEETGTVETRIEEPVEVSHASCEP